MKCTDDPNDNNKNYHSKNIENTETQLGISDSSSNANQTWPIGYKLLENYTVDDYLGEGGMGVVYRVRRERDGAYFAVKTLAQNQLTDSKARRIFLRELRTWLGLTDNPHLTACRFFRTIDDRLAIFAEYVDGGSLKDLIHERKLNEPAEAIDIAIQIIWGLKAAHRDGVVHRDIKPSNIMITKDGIVKITDFGLSRISAMKEQSQVTKTQIDGGMLTVEGMTPAYCSPEQAMGQHAGFESDIWSFGLTILELFCGGALWKIGTVAPFILQKITRKELIPDYLPIPESLITCLFRCFEHNPDDRWREPDKLTENLQSIYREITGVEYSRREPSWKQPIAYTHVKYQRKSKWGDTWDDPKIWLNHAAKLSGIDPNTLLAKIAKPSRDPRLQLIRDLEMFDIVIDLYQQIMDSDSHKFIREISRIHFCKALVQNQLNDLSGAIQNFLQSIHWFQKIWESYPGTTNGLEYAMLLKNCGNTYWRTGSTDKALDMYKKAKHTLTHISIKKNDPLVMELDSVLYMNQAIIITTQGAIDKALTYYEKALSIKKSLIDDHSLTHIRKDLAIVYINASVALYANKELHKALHMLDEAIHDITPDHDDEIDIDLQHSQCLILANKSAILNDLDRHEEAKILLNRMIEILQDVVYEKGISHLRNELAAAYMNRGYTFSQQYEFQSALNDYTESIRIREKLINLEGHDELSRDLGQAYFNKASLLFDLGKLKQAETLIEKARTLIGLTNIDNFKPDSDGLFFQVLMTQANIYTENNKLQKAIPLYQQCIKIIKHPEYAALFSENETLLFLINYSAFLRKKEAWQDARSELMEFYRPLHEIIELDKNGDRLYFYAHLCLELGVIHQHMNQFNKALDFHYQCEKIMNLIPSETVSPWIRFHRMKNYSSIAKILIDLHKNPDAEKWIEKFKCELKNPGKMTRFQKYNNFINNLPDFLKFI